MGGRRAVRLPAPLRDVRIPPVELPPPPRYGRASLAEVLPSVLGALGVDGARDVLDLAPLRRVVVLVVDGLGARQLAEHADTAPFLADAHGRTIDAVFPSTTAAGISSIGTGLAPGRHGLVGYASALPDEPHPLNLLTWRVGPQGGGRDVREQLPPERYQPAPTCLERAAAAGVATTVVLPPGFLTSGLTRAVLRGGSPAVASGLGPTLRTAVDAAATGTGPRLVYAYHAEVDAIGHLTGPGSDQWRDALRATDLALADLAADLPGEVTILVTADHGMVRVPDAKVVDVGDEPALTRGVRVVAGEPRMRQLFTSPGADPAEVARRWRGRLAGRAHVLTRAEALDAGLFGSAVAPRVRPRIGDVLAIARRGTVVHGDIDPLGGRLAGQHGALTRAEVEVPLVRIGA